MKGIFGPYVLWPLDKKFIFWIVTRVSARDYRTRAIITRSRFEAALDHKPQIFLKNTLFLLHKLSAV